MVKISNCQKNKTLSGEAMKNRLYTFYIFFALYYAFENKINYGEDCIKKHSSRTGYYRIHLNIF